MNSTVRAKLARYNRVMRTIRLTVSSLPRQPIIEEPDRDRTYRCRKMKLPVYFRYRICKEFLFGCEWRFWPCDQSPPDGWERDDPTDNIK